MKVKLANLGLESFVSEFKLQIFRATLVHTYIHDPTNQDLIELNKVFNPANEGIYL